MSELHRLSVVGPAGALECVVHMPAIAPRAIAVVAHPLPTGGGTMDNKVVTTLAKTFAELDFAAFRFNFRGVGASAGQFEGGDGEVEDVLAIVHHARHEYGHLPLILSGFSFGGYVQTRAAQQLQPHHLVLVAPAVGRIALPPAIPNTLLIHGELDEVVPLGDVLQWARPQHLPVVVIPETGHFFHRCLDQIREIVRGYFSGHAL